MNAQHVLAVVLAAFGATLFGLAAVRQHGAVRAVRTADHRGRRGVAVGRLLRERSWLLGAAQATVAGGSHLVALALAPITLVQPVGVLAVPVTLAGDALRSGQRPRGRQLLGAVLAVAAVGALTLILLAPAARPVQLPAWRPVLGVVVAVPALGLLVLRASRAWPDLVRCLALATTAALLYGLESVLVRTAGHLVVSGGVATHVPLLLVVVAGVALVLPVGLWSMQTAYAAGSPQVVLCCLTLVDPLAAVLGGFVLLGDGVALPAARLVEALGCAVLAAAGVLLLAWDRPAVGVDDAGGGGDRAEDQLSASRR